MTTKSKKKKLIRCENHLFK